MKFRTLILTLMLISSQFALANRGPAVEDFVGVDVEEPYFEPQGTEALFNFEKEIHKFEENKSKPFADKKSEQTNPSNSFTVFAFGLILGLPGIIWLMMMNHLKSKAKIESANNIEVLENYRKRREEANKAKDTIKKVS